MDTPTTKEIVMDVLEINVATGERVERAFTKQEKAQREADRKTFEKAEADRVAQEAASAQAKTDAITHAKSLGFTDEMIAVMYPNLA
jgi:ethanolamine utilization cobalamin adenosyltransferase